MSDWTDGYRAAIADLEKLIEVRFSATFPTRFRKAVAQLLADLRADASVIDHADLSRARRGELADANVARAAKGRRQGRLLD